MTPRLPQPAPEPAHEQPTTMTARCPEDILAAVEVLLGFTPECSIAMLTLGPTPSFHARIDLPRSSEEREIVFDRLLGPVLAYGVERVVFVVYSAERTGVAHLGAMLVDRFRAHGVYVVDALHADGQRWFPLLPGCVGSGVPYDLSCHRFRVQAVAEGVVTYGSRAELAQSLAPVPGPVQAVAEALGRLEEVGVDWDAEAVWLDGVLPGSGRVGHPPPLSAGDVARILRAVGRTDLRDLCWMRMTRAEADGHVAFWVDVLRRSPHPHAAVPAWLAAFAAWLSGQGALAWCALEECLASDARFPLAGLLTRVLDDAVSPRAWDGFLRAEAAGHC